LPPCCDEAIIPCGNKLNPCPRVQWVDSDELDICVTQGSDTMPSAIFVLKNIKIIEEMCAFLTESDKSVNLCMELDQGVLCGFENYPVSQSIMKDRFMSCQMAMPRLDSYSC